MTNLLINKRDVLRYSEMIQLPTIEARFEYLKLRGKVGEDTFGFDRWLNQYFYRSRRWRSTRNDIIIRDAGCDLGIEDREIGQGLIIHHMNQITVEDVEQDAWWLYDPEFLITTSDSTHKAIHYGDPNLLPKAFTPRSPGDTRLW